MKDNTIQLEFKATLEDVRKLLIVTIAQSSAKAEDKTVAMELAFAVEFNDVFFTMVKCMRNNEPCNTALTFNTDKKPKTTKGGILLFQSGIIKLFTSDKEFNDILAKYEDSVRERKRLLKQQQSERAKNTKNFGSDVHRHLSNDIVINKSRLPLVIVDSFWLAPKHDELIEEMTEISPRAKRITSLTNEELSVFYYYISLAEVTGSREFSYNPSEVSKVMNGNNKASGKYAKAIKSLSETILMFTYKDKKSKKLKITATKVINLNIEKGSKNKTVSISKDSISDDVLCDWCAKSYDITDLSNGAMNGIDLLKDKSRDIRIAVIGHIKHAPILKDKNTVTYRRLFEGTIRKRVAQETWNGFKGKPRHDFKRRIRETFELFGCSVMEINMETIRFDKTHATKDDIEHIKKKRKNDNLMKKQQLKTA